MNCRCYREIISAHVDGALSAGEELQAQAHLDECPGCAQTFAWEIKATKILRQSLSPLMPRRELKQNILDKLGPTENRSTGWLFMCRGWAPALLILFMTGSLYFVWPFRNQRDVLMETVAHYQRANENLNDFTRTAAGDPSARVLDLSAWGYHLLGRTAHQVGDRENRVFFYRGKQDDLLVAQELEGERLLAPRGSTVVRKSGKDFVSLAAGDINVVAWQDKNIICLLASKLPQHRVLALAADIAERG